jgi:Na+:H+ antiporter, NhaA family
MYRISPLLARFATALLLGGLIGTVWVNVAPGSYYDFDEWRLFGTALPGWLAAQPMLLTPTVIVGEGLMALFLALIGKELWEALRLERGVLSGRQAIGPLILMLGAATGGVLVWVVLALVFGQADNLPPGLGWTTPIGGDVVLAYLFGRMIFGPAHPALKLLLLVTITETLLGLMLTALFAADHPLRPVWLVLPLAAALAVWWRYGRLPTDASLQDQRRAQTMWPYAFAGLISWLGVLAAGLPGALGLLPVLPAVAHAVRSFGLFAEAEELLHDPLNRLAHLLGWPTTCAMFAFGLTQGAIDLSAFAPLTLVTLAALWLGRPAGLYVAAMLLARTGATGPAMAISRQDLIRLTPLLCLAFTGPVLGLPLGLPGGVMAEGARLGLALSLLAGPVAVLMARSRPQ